MARAFDWDRTRHDGKVKVSVSSECVKKSPPVTSAERARVKAENLARHKASVAESKKQHKLERARRAAEKLANTTHK